MTPERVEAPHESAERDPAAVEAALLARLAGGEREEPLIELYRLYGRRLYALGLRMLDDRSGAEELVQETFVRIWRSAERYDPTLASPRTWILLLARRVAIDLQRRAASRPRSAPHPIGLDGQGHDPLAPIPAEDEFERAVIGMDVREAMLSLSADHREVLELGYRHRLTQAEIAARLGIPLGTVKTRTYYGLRELKSRLEELRLL